MSERPVDCFIGIVGGEVKCAVSASDPKIVSKAVSEWMSREPFPNIIRVPTEVARAYLFRPWPGLDAALTSPSPAEEG